MLCILEHFTNNVHELYIFCKMRGYPPFSSLISVTLVKIYISCLIVNQGKNTFELVDTISIVPITPKTSFAKVNYCVMLSKIAELVVILVKTGFFSEFLKYGFSAPQVGVKGRLVLMNYSPDISKRAKKAKAEGRQQQKQQTSYLKTAVIQLTFVKSSNVYYMALNDFNLVQILRTPKQKITSYCRS